ncbi:hypothetical protein CDAR_394301 [Caerostris darwini]|uniref:Uncharacterized protein n=1 Tax=Caerostris darwini TaxID=1538125 RepID=A0AAV4RDJ3_9ARAC|nr:hypothetical protein CDAR_394301 [Caerostris darwini]
MSSFATSQTIRRRQPSTTTPFFSGKGTPSSLFSNPPSIEQFTPFYLKICSSSIGCHEYLSQWKGIHANCRKDRVFIFVPSTLSPPFDAFNIGILFLEWFEEQEVVMYLSVYPFPKIEKSFDGPRLAVLLRVCALFN